MSSIGDGGVAAAGLILALPGVIDLCIKYGRFLKDRVHNYRHIKELARVSRFVVELVEGEVNQVLLFFRAQHEVSVPDSQTSALAQQLRCLLEKISAMFPDPEPGLWERLVFSAHGKDSIERACIELKDWHARLLRHFFVRAILGAPEVPEGGGRIKIQSKMLSRVQRIRAAIMDPDALVNAQALQLETFDNAVAFQPLVGSNIVVTDVGKELVEYRQYSALATPQVVAATQGLVREIAARLHEAESATRGLLYCKGFTPEPLKCRFALRFNYPAGKDAVSTLQSLLMHQENAAGVKHSLSDRVALARRIASAVLYMHTCGFVHKSIRPDNILIFEEGVAPGGDQAKHKYPHVIGEPFLVGFDSMRKAVAASNMIKVEEWKKNVYLHPDRHRMSQGDEYTVRHDLYSLGVVFLEIAMWGCFTDERPNGMARRYVWHTAQGAPPSPLSPEELQERYLKLAKSMIPRYIGAKYADIVVSCLEGLQDEEAGGLLDDQDGMVIETAYFSQILMKLEEISL